MLNFFVSFTRMKLPEFFVRFQEFFSNPERKGLPFRRITMLSALRSPGALAPRRNLRLIESARDLVEPEAIGAHAFDFAEDFLLMPVTNIRRPLSLTSWLNS